MTTEAEPVPDTDAAQAATALPSSAGGLRHVLGMDDVGHALGGLLDLALDYKARHKSGDVWGPAEAPLRGKSAVLLFEKPSTRTRVSFEVALAKLGATSTTLTRNDCQLGRGESVEDTALVLARYADVLVYRAYRHADAEELARCSTSPVINALTDLEHPCQILADLLTVLERRGSLGGTRFLYVGDGANNMSHSYLLGCAWAGMHATIACPPQYAPNPDVIARARVIAKETGGSVTVTHDVASAYANQEVVATDTWVSMGDEADKDLHLAAFKGFTVDDACMDRAAPDAFFLHCLPAYYGYECTKELAHGPRSAVGDEAENRLWAQMALLAWCLGKA